MQELNQIQIKIMKEIINKCKKALKAIYLLSVTFLFVVCVNLHHKNKKLSEGLEIAQNNVESYVGTINNLNNQNNTLLLTVDQLQYSNDSLLQKMNEVIENNKINKKNINTIATQTQNIYVSNSKGVRGQDIDNNLTGILIEDSIYNDSIQYNNLTKVYYTISNDTVNITLDIKNTQYLLTFKNKQYKNKKTFVKRLLTLDFKKVWKYEYKIINSNDILQTSDVRVVEIIQ